MKKITILTIALALLFGACRKDADYMPYIGENGDLAYSTYTGQFDYIWNTFSTGYVFWDVDQTDWDEVYDKFYPEFQKLDEEYEHNGAVSTNKIGILYRDMFANVSDHHLSIYLANLHPYDNDYHIFSINPGMQEAASRDYYIESTSDEQIAIDEFLNNLDGLSNIDVHESCEIYVPELYRNVKYHYLLINLDDGRKIPYLWQSCAALTPAMIEQGEAAHLIDKYFKAIVETPHDELAGIILDNRANIGGFQDDLDLLLGSYINNKTEIFKTRYKEGPGRLEHSAWTPYYISPYSKYHRDITEDNIPYVILCDINSISMGEIETMVIKSVLPTAFTIGERTFGATGPLQPETRINLNYGGPYGDPTLENSMHYVYTATFETLIEGKVWEGVGFTPDSIVLRKDYDGNFKPQLDAAIEYIRNYK